MRELSWELIRDIFEFYSIFEVLKFWKTICEWRNPIVEDLELQSKLDSVSERIKRLTSEQEVIQLRSSTWLGES